MAVAKQSIEIHASTKSCYDVITDYEAYPQFIKELKNIESVKKGAHAWEVRFTMELIKKFSYTLKIAGKPPTSVSWNMIDGEWMKSNDGSWHLEDLGGGVTRATYSIEVGLGLLVPGTISKMLIGSNLPATLQAFKKRIEGKKKK